MNIKRALSSFILGCLTYVSWGQGGFLKSDIKFEHFSEGLSQNTVSAIEQDKYGFIWVGTWSGLNRFDGVDFKVYERFQSDSTSLGNNYVFDIFEDSRGDLWVGTSDGLSKYNWGMDNFETIRNDPNDPESLSGTSITSIFEDSHGNFWIGTERSGLNLFDRDTKKAIRFIHESENPNSISNNSVTTIFEDRTGRVWAGNRMGGLNRFDSVGGHFTRYQAEDNGTHSISNNDIRDSFRASDGSIWVGTSQGANLMYMNATGEVFFRKFLHEEGNPNSIIHNTVPEIAEDDFGNIWLGTENGGLSIYNVQSNSFKHITYDPANKNGIKGNSIWHLYKDNDGTMWMGTLDGGLSKSEKIPGKFIKVQANPASNNALSHNNVTCFIEDSNNGVWIGTDGGGLNYYDTKTGKYTHYRHNSDDNTSIGSDAVISLYEDSKGRIWVGTWEGGLNLFNPKTKNFKRYQNDPSNPNSISRNSVFDMMEDSKGQFWVGAYWGALELFDPTDETFRHFHLNQSGNENHLENAIEKIIEDEEGNLWIATWGEGLVKFKWDGLNTTSLEYFKHQNGFENSISSNVVISALQDSRGTLWFGTNAGLNKYDKETNSFTLYTKEEGLPNDDIHCIIEDQSRNLWIATNKGISKFNPLTETFKNYDATDGLQSNQFIRGSGMKDREGKLFFGGINGFNVFKPDKVRENQRLPIIHVTDFSVHNERIQSADRGSPLKKAVIESNRIELDHDENVFQFEFVAINYTEATKNEYAFILDGYDDDWRYVGNQRYANYTRVPPGEYTFKVKASNNDDLWNEAGVEIAVLILPPWWQAWWAFTIYSLLGIGFLYLGRTTIVNRERLKSNLKLEHLELVKMQEMDQLKSRFFANISHEFRTPLSLILGPLRSIYYGTYEGDQNKQFSIMIRNGQRLLQLINQLLDLSKLESGKMSLRVIRLNLADFLKPILASFLSHAQKQHLQYKILYQDDDIVAYVDKDKLEKIVLNLLSNAFKFTPEFGTISINLEKIPPNKKYKEGGAIIKIRDTGIGIPDDKLELVFNRFYQVGGNHDDKRKGTGIGLSLTKELVELHGGEILVESIEGKGTTFTILLPSSGDHLNNADIIDGKIEKELFEGAPESVDLIIEDDYSPERSLEARSQIGHLQTILVIDDNEDIRSYLTQQLEVNYKIIESDNGTDGFDMAVGELPDLVISDVMMPGINGLKLCEKIKMDERTCHIPVILLTAKADSENKIEGFEAGADYYVTKPFNSNILELRVKNILKARQTVRDHYNTNSSIDLEPSNIKLTSPDETFLKKALESVESNMANSEFSVEDFGKEVGMSRMQLYRKMKALTGQSANEFIRTIRLKRAAQLIAQEHLTIAEVTYEVGFNDLQYFRDCFKKQFGVNPSKYSLNTD